MKLKEYIKNLQAIIERNPKSANYNVIYSIDDEGNGFNSVEHAPSFGNFIGGDFIQDDETKEFEENYKINAICIN